MISFNEWFLEYAGMTVGMFANNKQYKASGVQSKWNAEGTGKVSYGKDKASCLYMKKNCKKKEK